MTEDRQEYIEHLAAELLDDIELNRLTAEALVLKGMRLARLTGDDETKKWLAYEMSGYSDTSEFSLRYMTLTGRWLDYEKRSGYWGPLAQHEATLESLKVRLASFTTQGLGGETAVGALLHMQRMTGSIANDITRFSGIRSRALGLLHRFVVRVHHEALFSRTAAGIFESFRAQVDPLLQSSATGLTDRMESSYTRLVEGDGEAISAALNTCRRVIDAFADAIYPPADLPIEIDGQSIQVGASNHLNRINAFVASRTHSDSRRKRIRQSLANLYKRVCAGIHDDVLPSEAQALVLSTYTLLGELALIRTEPTLTEDFHGTSPSQQAGPEPS